VKRYQEYARSKFSKLERAEDRERDLQIALGITIAQINKAYRVQKSEDRIVDWKIMANLQLQNKILVLIQGNSSVF